MTVFRKAAAQRIATYCARLMRNPPLILRWEEKLRNRLNRTEQVSSQTKANEIRGSFGMEPSDVTGGRLKYVYIAVLIGDCKLYMTSVVRR
jgi:hypothetical protein